MPSTSPAQARTMAGAAHDPAFAKKMGIPQDVAKDFNQADKGTKLLSQANSKKRSARDRYSRKTVVSGKGDRGKNAPAPTPGPVG